MPIIYYAITMDPILIALTTLSSSKRTYMEKFSCRSWMPSYAKSCVLSFPSPQYICKNSSNELCVALQIRIYLKPLHGFFSFFVAQLDNVVDFPQYNHILMSWHNGGLFVLFWHDTSAHLCLGYLRLCILTSCIKSAIILYGEYCYSHRLQSNYQIFV